MQASREGEEKGGERRDGAHHSRDRNTKKGDVGAEEEEGEKMEGFFYNLHNFLVDTNVPIVVATPAIVPEFRFISFVPALLPWPSPSSSRSSG